MPVEAPSGWWPASEVRGTAITRPSNLRGGPDGTGDAVQDLRALSGMNEREGVRRVDLDHGPAALARPLGLRAEVLADAVHEPGRQPRGPAVERDRGLERRDRHRRHALEPFGRERRRVARSPLSVAARGGLLA